MLARMDEPVRQRTLELADPVAAQNLHDLSRVPPGSAGSLMDPRMAAFWPTTTVLESMRRLLALKAAGPADSLLGRTETTALAPSRYGG